MKTKRDQDERRKKKPRFCIHLSDNGSESEQGFGLGLGELKLDLSPCDHIWRGGGWVKNLRLVMGSREGC